MSKLVDKLKQLSRAVAPPMGFRPAPSLKQSLPMLLIVSLTQVNPETIKLIANVGVDAAIVPGKLLEEGDLEQVVNVLGDIPLGLALKEANYEDVIKMAKSGYDFIVFSPKSPSEILEIKNVGKILEIKPSLESGLVKAISDLPLPVDGVFVAGDEPVITIEYLLICQRFVELLDKPVLATVPSSVSSNQISSLWEIGIDGVIVSGEQSEERLVELKKAVKNLPLRTKSRGKVSVILPPPSPERARIEVEEEEIKALMDSKSPKNYL